MSSWWIFWCLCTVHLYLLWLISVRILFRQILKWLHQVPFMSIFLYFPFIYTKGVSVLEINTIFLYLSEGWLLVLHLFYYLSLYWGIDIVDVEINQCPLLFVLVWIISLFDLSLWYYLLLFLGVIILLWLEVFFYHLL